MTLKPLKECRVLVTPTSYGKEEPVLRTQLESQVGEVIYNTTGKPLASDQLVELIRGVDGYIAGLDMISAAVIEAADCLKVIARYGVGVDAVDLEAAKRKGIIVTNTPGANSSSVAELALGLMLSLARNIPAAVEMTRSGQWPRLRGMTIEGKTVGLVGLGAIGKIVARLLSGFGCTVLAYDPFVDPARAAAAGIQLLPWEEVVRRSDFVSLHCPVTPETRRLVDAAFLAQMKPGAFLINTARGELVDEDALYAALASGKLAGAALDVFASQPPGADHPLLKMPQVISTPHMGAHTDGATSAMGWGALNDCLAVLRGEEPRFRMV
jgi:D-3-phosphoglycerate dehydrogenase